MEANDGGEASSKPPLSPPSPPVRKASRRSSIATARRLSRVSGVGASIPLSDLLATVPQEDEASVLERLSKVISLCLNSSVRQVEAELAEDEAEDTAKEVGHLLRKQAAAADSSSAAAAVAAVAARLEDGGLLEGGAGGAVGAARRKVLETTARYKAEHAQWGEVVKERREQLRRAAAVAREAERGEVAVTEARRFCLTAEERTRLDSLGDSSEARQHLKRFREQEELLVQAVSTKMARQKCALNKVDRDMDTFARELISRADKVGGKLDDLESDKLLLEPSDVL